MAERPDTIDDRRTRRRPLRTLLWRATFGLVLVLALVVGGTMVRVWQVARIDDRTPADVVVVLGAAQYDGEPSSVLGARLDHAARLWRTGVAPVIVTVGGRQAGDNFTEAQAGKDYLVSYGIPEQAVIEVDEGNDTLGSVRAVSDAATRHGWSTMVLVSDPWHSQRARTMARDLGMDAWTSPTRSGPVVQTRQVQARYILREGAALMYYRLTHASAESISADLG